MAHLGMVELISLAAPSPKVFWKIKTRVCACRRERARTLALARYASIGMSNCRMQAVLATKIVGREKILVTELRSHFVVGVEQKDDLDILFVIFIENLVHEGMDLHVPQVILAPHRLPEQIRERFLQYWQLRLDEHDSLVLLFLLFVVVFQNVVLQFTAEQGLA